QSPTHPQHHPPSPVQSIPSHHPPSPGQGPLSPSSNQNPSSVQHPPTPQTPQTPTFIPRVVLTIHDGNESEGLLQDEINFGDVFGNSNSYEQGSFESDILENMSRLDESELSMMVVEGTIDQLVDQETEESFRRDHRTTSSTSSGP
ncbi:hypothetical protein OTU49_004536, partial [Cherax quadricarinatus]